MARFFQILRKKNQIQSTHDIKNVCEVGNVFDIIDSSIRDPKLYPQNGSSKSPPLRV